MKLSIGLLVACLTTGMAQRSPYAPKPVGYPTVLDQFNTNTDTANNNVPNRFGGENEETYQGPLKPQPGTIGDPYLVPRLPEWPREHQPFWYLNQQHIMNHRGQQVPAPVQPANGGQTANAAPTGTLNGRLGPGGQQRAPVRNEDTDFQSARRSASVERPRHSWTHGNQ